MLRAIVWLIFRQRVRISLQPPGPHVHRGRTAWPCAQVRTSPRWSQRRRTPALLQDQLTSGGTKPRARAI